MYNVAVIDAPQQKGHKELKNSLLDIEKLLMSLV